MLTNSFCKPLSLCLSPIHLTEQARVNDARAFFRVSTNLGFARRSTLIKFSRYIRYGILSVSDAQGIILNRLRADKMRRYQLFKYWVSYGFENEQSFYFNPVQLWQDMESVEKENIIRFP